MKKGFTLIELLIVISIIGILAVALVPSITNAPAKARDAERMIILKEYYGKIVEFNLEYSRYPEGSFCIGSGDGGTDEEILVNEFFNGELPGIKSVNPDVECDGGVYYFRNTDEEVTDAGFKYFLLVTAAEDNGGMTVEWPPDRPPEEQQDVINILLLGY